MENTLVKSDIMIIDDNSDLFKSFQEGLGHNCNLQFVRSRNNIIKHLAVISRPDIIFLNVSIKNADVFKILLTLSNSEEYGDIPVLLISSGDCIIDRTKGFSSGAIGYIIKPFIYNEIAEIIESIIRFKQRCIESHNIRIESELIRSIKNLDKANDTLIDTDLPENIYMKYNVTLREREIIELLLAGLLNKEISVRLHISKRTVEFHIYNIYNKFNVKNRLELLNLFKK